MFKDKTIRVDDCNTKISIFVGRREKCFNPRMNEYFTSTKNNFGPIKIKRSLRKHINPY
jgi:hypothetical protein